MRERERESTQAFVCGRDEEDSVWEAAKQTVSSRALFIVITILKLEFCWDVNKVDTDLILMKTTQVSLSYFEEEFYQLARGSRAFQCTDFDPKYQNIFHWTNASSRLNTT